jgi:tripartite-type tricarboxylate transporter receptor subunit TctC
VIIKKVWLLTFAAASWVGIASAQPQAYPQRAIAMVVGSAPGGPTDVVARLVADRMSQRLGQPVVVENKPGAAGFTSVLDVKNAPANGYKVLFSYSALFSINPAIFKSLPYDAENDFVPLSLAVTVPQVLVSPPQLGVSKVPELVSWLRSNPDKAAFGSSGIGTSMHISGELFSKANGARALHVPYKGQSPAHNDLLTGRIHFMFDPLPGVVPLLKAGKLVPLAVSSKTRHPLLPEVPTLAEVGVPGVGIDAWFGFHVRSGTPPDIVEKLSSTIQAVLQETDTRSRLESMGADPIGSTSAEAAKVIRDDAQRWRKLVSEIGIEPQ